MSNKIEAAVSDLTEQWERFKSSHVSRIDENRQRLEMLEAGASLPAANAGNGPDPAELKACDEYLRGILQHKAVTVGSATGGGNAQPEVLSRMIWAQIPRYSPVLELVTVEDASSGDWHKIVTDLGHGSGWVGEGDSRSETDTALIHRISPTFGTVYARPKASEESVQDLMFNVVDWFTQESAKHFAKDIGEAILTGNGTSKPTGMLNGTINSIPDFGASPERVFGDIEYIPTGTAATLGGDRLSSPQGNAGDVLIDTFFALNAFHRQRASWVMNSATFAAVRKLKDADGDYLWARGFSPAGEILGRPVVVAEGVADVGANAYPIICADFEAAYVVARIGDVRVTVDDNITVPGYVQSYVRQRLGGALMDSNAIKVVKCATS
jgi:HK97 family phage major capsid protein